MKQQQTTVTVKTSGVGLTNITAAVQSEVAASGVRTGLCHLFLRHTSASLVIQENADPDVLRDLNTFMARLVPENDSYRHADEGPDDMPAHIRSVLTHTSETIPIAGGKLSLGTWQGVYVWEHRHAAHQREVIVHVVGT